MSWGYFWTHFLPMLLIAGSFVSLFLWVAGSMVVSFFLDTLTARLDRFIGDDDDDSPKKTPLKPVS